MGCDIHAYLEIKNGDEWECLAFTNVETDDGISEQPINFYEGRSYTLFSILAGVRGNYPSYFDVRGVPEDVSEPIKQVIADWGCDGHTHSYVTMEELLECEDSLFKEAFRSGFHDSDPNYDIAGYRSVFYFISSALAQARDYKRLRSDRLGLCQARNSKDELRVVFFFDN